MPAIFGAATAIIVGLALAVFASVRGFAEWRIARIRARHVAQLEG